MIPNLAQKYFDLVGVIFVALDTEGKITRINEKACEILGYDQGELLGRNWFETCLPENCREKTRDVFQKMILGEKAGATYYDNPVRSKSGEERYISWHNAMLTEENGAVSGTLSVGVDITRRKASESALKESKLSLASLLANLPGMVYRCRNDRNWTMEYVSEGCYEMTGYAPRDLYENKKVSFSEIIHEEDRKRVWHEIQEALSKGGRYRLTYRIKTKQGEIKWVWEQGQGVFTPGNKLIGLEGFITNITDQIVAEKALIESEARIRAILETAFDGIVTIDEKGEIETFNSAAERLFGFSATEVIGKNVRILMPDPYHKEHDSYLKNYRRTGDKKIIGSGREVVGRRKDGSTFPLYLAVGETHIGNRRVFTGTVHDLTEQNSLQQKILQSERLAVIGKMAAKVAHEVRNPLSSISLNAELLEEELQDNAGDKEEAKSLLESMVREIERVSALTDEYLQFSRLPEFTPAENDLNTLIRETMAVHSQELRQKKIRFKGQGLQKELRANFDRSQIRRLLLNLVRNAIEAMPDGGTLKIATDRVNEHSVISVQDTGVGIPKQELENIFVPFFTTKDYGTGLGLVISQQIVHEHDGKIVCQSKTKVGTTFMVELPVMPKRKRN